MPESLNAKCYLEGKTISKITGVEVNSREIYIETSNGEKYQFYHSQDCCESVSVEDVQGNINNILNTPIKRFTETITRGGDSWTRTRHRITTEKGSLVIIWLGESNGWYNEDVTFCRG